MNNHQYLIHNTPLQYSCLENPMGRRAWKAAVHGVTKSRARLNDFTFSFHFHALEKEMATHSSVLAWRIPGTGEPGRLPSMGSHRVRHDWRDLAVAVVGEATLHSFSSIHSTHMWFLLSPSCLWGSVGIQGKPQPLKTHCFQVRRRKR